MTERSNKYVFNDIKQWKSLKDKAKYLRLNLTPSEKLIWNELKSNKLGVKFRRQYIIENYIADFICLEKKIIIEIDGEIHKNKIEYDNYRTEIIKLHNFRVIRFKNEEIYKNLDIVLQKIKNGINSIDKIFH